MTIALFLVAAFVLVAFGGLFAAVDAALLTLSRSDLLELSERYRAKRSLKAIALDPGAHLNAANFVRVVSETTAAVLVTSISPAPAAHARRAVTLTASPSEVNSVCDSSPTAPTQARPVPGRRDAHEAITLRPGATRSVHGPLASPVWCRDGARASARRRRRKGPDDRGPP